MTDSQSTDKSFSMFSMALACPLKKTVYECGVLTYSLKT